MPEIRDLLKAGAHFGHQKQRWNPKMAPYIFTERNNIHIIDLQKTMGLIEDAKKFVKSIGISGGSIFLVGTKRQAQEVIKEEAEKAELPYVNYRWLGGMLTNFATINQSVKKLQKFDDILNSEKRKLYKKKELADIDKKKTKLERNLSGISKMEKMPSAIFIVDPVKEHLAVHEARLLGIPIVAIIDTNGDPTHIDFLIPANDDGMRCVSIITSELVASYMEGFDIYKQKIVTEQKDRKDKPTRAETRSVAGRKVRVKRIATSDNPEDDEENVMEEEMKSVEAEVKSAEIAKKEE